MEPGQYAPAGEPQKVRNRKPKTRYPTSQGIPGQPPPARKTNHGAPQPQPQPPEEANWGYDQYGNADPAQSYPEHYGYGTGEHVDAHAYYGSAHLDSAGHGYDYDYGYDHGGGHEYAGQDYGHDYGHGGYVQADAGQNYGYDGTQVDVGQDYVYVAPTQEGKGRVKKPRNPRPVADGQEAGYENQGHGSAYNVAVVPEQQSSQYPQKREPKPRKPSRSKAETGNHENPLASRALTGEPDGPGSASAGSGRSSNPERRKKKVENAASTIPEAANALNEHLRKAGSGKKPAFQDVSMAVFDPHDRTLIMPEPSLDEWMKKQGNNVGKVKQDESLIVFDDHDKSELETHMFGTPLANSQQTIKLPPVDEQPQYHPRGPAANQNYQAVVPAVGKSLYPHARPRPAGYANSPGLPRAYQGPVQEAGAIQEYNNVAYAGNNIDNKEALQPVTPNAKCMACVHGVGVPLARLATRFACRQCMNCSCLQYACTIL